MIIVLSILLVVTIILLVLSVRLNLKYTDKFAEIVERTEESLDILDACYKRIVYKTSMDVLSNDPVIHELVDDMKLSRDAVLLVANLIAEPIALVENEDGE